MTSCEPAGELRPSRIASKSSLPGKLGQSIIMRNAFSQFPSSASRAVRPSVITLQRGCEGVVGHPSWRWTSFGQTKHVCDMHETSCYVIGGCRERGGRRSPDAESLRLGGLRDTGWVIRWGEFGLVGGNQGLCFEYRRSLWIFVHLVSKYSCGFIQRIHTYNIQRTVVVSESTKELQEYILNKFPKI